MRFLYAPLVFLFIAGCSTLSKEECQSSNWLERGKSDALRGISNPRHTGYQKDCSEHGIKIDDKKYLKGYDEGLKLYCTYKSGYDRGLKDEDQHLYCQQKSIEFSKGYSLGLEVHQHNKDKAEAIKKMKKQLISINGAFECPSSRICEQQTSCTFNRCTHNGAQCSFDYECKEIGQCISVSGYTRFSELATVNVCKFIH